MFRAWCDTWETDILVWPSNIENIANTDQGILLSYQCACGSHGQMLSGAASHRTVTGHTRP
jgi:hypothetical protein